MAGTQRGNRLHGGGTVSLCRASASGRTPGKRATAKGNLTIRNRMVPYPTKTVPILQRLAGLDGTRGTCIDYRSDINRYGTLLNYICVHTEYIKTFDYSIIMSLIRRKYVVPLYVSPG
jgi:hypothetical protein